MLEPISSDHDSGSGVRLDRPSFPRSNPRSLFGVFQRWYHVSVLRLLIAEFRNLFHHIEVALEMREREIRGSKGSVRSPLHAPLVFGSQSSKRAYIRYTQQLQVEYPHLTILDHF